MTAESVGVLLAAGRGRRMGGSKQLILRDTPDGPKPLVVCAFDAIAPACAQMIVVLGHAADAVAAALAPRDFVTVEADPDASMFASVRAGLRAAYAAAPGASVLLHPADHARVEAVTLRALKAAFDRDPYRAVLPEFAGKGGHPVLIPAALLPELIAAPDDGGLRAYWERHPELVVRLPVDDGGVVMDVDTPGDL